jgi:hypothetical protein
MASPFGAANRKRTPTVVVGETSVRHEEEAEYYRKLNITMVNGMPSGTIPGATMDDLNIATDATTDWLSFFLMTIGAFAPY